MACDQWICYKVIVVITDLCFHQTNTCNIALKEARQGLHKKTALEL